MAFSAVNDADAAIGSAYGENRVLSVSEIGSVAYLLSRKSQAGRFALAFEVRSGESCKALKRGSAPDLYGVRKRAVIYLELVLLDEGQEVLA